MRILFLWLFLEIKMTHDKLRPRVGVGVVVIKNKMLLLGKRKGAHGAGDWAFPGGHLEFGEEVEECARRELIEETGLKARSVRLGPWVNDVIDCDKHYITLFVFVNEFEGDLQLLEPHKCVGWQWFECCSLPTPLFPSIVSLIKKIGLEKLV
jgi:8-oxo-dGTP diphosphatase